MDRVLTEKCSGTKPIFNLLSAILALEVEKKAAAFALLAEVAIAVPSGLCRLCMLSWRNNGRDISSRVLTAAPVTATSLPSLSLLLDLS